MKSLLAATCLLGVSASGCIKQDGAPGEIGRAIPTSDQVAINLPATTSGTSSRLEAPTVGQLATYYLATRGVTQTFNGGSAWVLILVHTIVSYPVTSVDGNVYTWGPWTGNALDPADYKLDVTANADGTYDYVLSGHQKSDTTDHFIAVLTGHADPTPGENKGNGNFLLDFDAARTVDPIDNANNHGQVKVDYDLAKMHLDLTITTTDANNQAQSLDYAYDQTTDGGGSMQLQLVANVGGTAAEENVELHSRWLGTGAGRGDAKISGGDLGSEQAIASECWDTSFDRVYYTDNVNFEPTEGDASQCAYSDVDLPE
ncbi:MAG TPA: hypothetical protein VLX92_15575 [Kofleriaceae bacterium]|nr:hypothetical protein [Kofleriaceae bacterium]